MNKKGITPNLGIMSLEELQAYTLAIAQGKFKPKSGDPKIWCTSMDQAEKLRSCEDQLSQHLIKDL